MTNANQLTSAIISYLCLNGCYAWRENTVGVYDAKIGVYRKGNYTRGKSDILGIRKHDGKLIAIEVKVGKDLLSYEQSMFLNKITENNGIAYVANNFDSFLEWFKKW